MKITPKCFVCELEGALEQIELSTDDEELQFEALKVVLDYLSKNIRSDTAPAKIGTARNKIIKEVTNNPDPYLEIKNNMNETAAELVPIAREYIEKSENQEEEMKRTIKTAVIGNSFDFSVSEHELDFSTFKKKFREALKEEICIDDTDIVASKIISSDKIVYLLDNAGEALLDKLLLEKIEDFAKEITIVARSGPTQDDITVEMAEDLNLSEFGDLIPGGQVTGFDPVEGSEEFRSRLGDADLVLSKGQGNFEVFSEYEGLFEGRLAYLLMGKCEPVSGFLGVSQGGTVVYFVSS